MSINAIISSYTAESLESQYEEVDVDTLTMEAIDGYYHTAEMHFSNASTINDNLNNLYKLDSELTLESSSAESRYWANLAASVILGDSVDVSDVESMTLLSDDDKKKKNIIVRAFEAIVNAIKKAWEAVVNFFKRLFGISEKKTEEIKKDIDKTKDAGMRPPNAREKEAIDKADMKVSKRDLANAASKSKELTEKLSGVNDSVKKVEKAKDDLSKDIVRRAKEVLDSTNEKEVSDAVRDFFNGADSYYSQHDRLMYEYNKLDNEIESVVSTFNAVFGVNKANIKVNKTEQKGFLVNTDDKLVRYPIDRSNMAEAVKNAMLDKDVDINTYRSVLNDLYEAFDKLAKNRKTMDEITKKRDEMIGNLRAVLSKNHNLTPTALRQIMAPFNDNTHIRNFMDVTRGILSNNMGVYEITKTGSSRIVSIEELDALMESDKSLVM